MFDDKPKPKKLGAPYGRFVGVEPICYYVKRVSNEPDETWACIHDLSSHEDTYSEPCVGVHWRECPLNPERLRNDPASLGEYFSLLMAKAPKKYPTTLAVANAFRCKKSFVEKCIETFHADPTSKRRLPIC